MRRKTYKRETGWISMAYVAGLGIYAVAQGDPQAVALVEALALPVLAFAAAALGLDEYSKNIAPGRDHRGLDR